MTFFLVMQLRVYLASVPYAENATSEGHYQTMLYVVFSLLGRYVQMEVRTAKGHFDMTLQTATNLYVMDHPDRLAAVAARHQTGS